MDKTPEEKISLFIPTVEVDACLDEIRECLEMGWTGAGFKTVEFENSCLSSVLDLREQIQF